jgi:hypothetical protein
MSNTTARKGLVLSLGGAPSEPHTVPGAPGQFHPDRPVPVGGKGDRLSLEQAKKFADNPSFPLALVDLPATADVDELREQADADVKAARQGVKEARKQRVRGDEAAALSQHEKAVTAGKGA